MSSNEEVENACSDNSWPRLAMLGSSIIAAQESALVVDGKAIGKYPSFLTALTLLFGVYNVFNIEYPGAAAVTLDFIQRCFMGIAPDADGCGKNNKRKRSSVNPKVLRLINELADYEWNETD